MEEGKEDTLVRWRAGVLWYLGARLDFVAGGWREMVERRVRREVERGRSDLASATVMPTPGDKDRKGTTALSSLIEEEEREAEAKKRRHAGPNGSIAGNNMVLGKGSAGAGGAVVDDDDLTPAQLQLFAEENHGLLQYYTDTLSQVRTAEKSILEISELQTQLVDNLSLQSGQISQLVGDSERTEENVGGGNRELKRATERRSVARMVFWASVGLCGFLVGWDLVF